MSKAFDEIKAGLEDAIAYAEGDVGRGVAHAVPLVDITELREAFGFSQAQFAEAFHMSVGTLRHWEQGSREPRGAARLLLYLIAKEPKAVQRALGIRKLPRKKRGPGRPRGGRASHAASQEANG